MLATWHLMLDSGRLQDGEAFLAGTAARPVARVAAALAGPARALTTVRRWRCPPSTAP